MMGVNTNRKIGFLTAVSVVALFGVSSQSMAQSGRVNQTVEPPAAGDGGSAIVPQVTLGAPVPSHVVRDDDPVIGRRLVTPVRKWQDAKLEPRAVVLLIHGFPEHGLLYDKLATQLAEAGYVVYAPDMRGLGRAYTSGVATKVEYTGCADTDVTRLAELLRKEHKGLPLYVGGESMGGALAIRLAANHPELVDGLILSGPALKLEHHYARMIPQSFINVVTLHTVKVDFTKQIENFFSSDPRVVRELVCDPLVRKSFDTGELLQARRLPRQTEWHVGKIPSRVPVLVLQSCDDHQVKPSGLCLFDAQLRSNDVTYIFRAWGGHTILQTEYVDAFSVKTVREWLDKHTR